MSTPAQFNANKTNAQASTGPITPEGKAASSRNATSHGLSSAVFCLLPGEDVTAYRTSLAAFTQTFRPANIHETYLVETMVQSQWKLARAQRMEAALVVQMIAADPENKTAAGAVAAALLAGTAGPYKTLQRYQAAAERSYDRASREFFATRRQAPRPDPVPPPEKAPVPNEPNRAFGEPHRGMRIVRPHAPKPGCPNFNQRISPRRAAA